MKVRQRKHLLPTRKRLRRLVVRKYWINPAKRKIPDGWTVEIADVAFQHGIDLEQELSDILQEEIWKEFEAQEGKPRAEIQKQWDKEDQEKINLLAKAMGINRNENI